MLEINYELKTEFVTVLHHVYGYPIGMKCEQYMEMVFVEEEPEIH